MIYRILTAVCSFGNGLPGLATAFADRSPIFVVTSSPPLREAETNSLQGFHDQVVLAKPVTKFVHRVTNVEEIPRIVTFAYRSAMGGIPGPVVVDFPIDVLFHPPRMSSISYGSLMRNPAISPYPDPAALDNLISLWKAASRPVIITGTGAARTTDRESTTPKASPLLRLAEATDTPVFFSQKYTPALPYDSPLRGGQASRLATLPYINKQQPDFILLLGARTGFLLGGRSGAIIPNTGCKLAQVDIDGTEIGRSLAIDLGIVSDATKFITALLAKLEQPETETESQSQPETTGIPKHASWLRDIQDLTTFPSPYASESEKLPDGRLHPFHAVRAIYESLPRGSIIIIDGGEAGIWAAELLDSAQPAAALVSTGYLGFLGNGWGYSLGAALASPSRLVVNMHGDGSAGFHLQELDTYARHGLRVLTVVLNNFAWGMSVAGQDLMYADQDAARVASGLSPACRYDLVAGGFGCEHALVDGGVGEVKKAVARLTSTDNGPGLLNVIISKNPVTRVTQAMVGKTDDKDWIVVPYYDNVPRPYYKEAGTNAGSSAGENGTNGVGNGGGH